MATARLRSSAQTIRADLDDRSLVDLAIGGSEAAIRHIIRRYNRRLFRVARAVLRNDAEAEEVVQETYLRAFSQLQGFRGEASLATWLTRIALNEALGRLRRRKPARDFNDLIASASNDEKADIMLLRPAATPEVDLSRQEIRRMLEQVVDTLPEPFRIVFIMRDIEEMSIEDVARQLAIKPETVKTRLHRARRLIRTALQEQFASAFSELFPFDGARCIGITEQVIGQLRSRQILPPIEAAD